MEERLTVVGAIILFFVLVSGCMETGDGSAAPSDLLGDEKAEAVRIALDNTTVREYLSGEYEIRDVYYGTLTRVSGGVERSERLPVVAIETRDVRLWVFVDLEKEMVIAIAKDYERAPIIMPPITQSVSTPPEGEAPTVPIPTPNEAH